MTESEEAHLLAVLPNNSPGRQKFGSGGQEIHFQPSRRMPSVLKLRVLAPAGELAKLGRQFVQGDRNSHVEVKGLSVKVGQEARQSRGTDQRHICIRPEFLQCLEGLDLALGKRHYPRCGKNRVRTS